MTDFRLIELRQLDLTVLLVFLGLVRTRKATQVAAELGLTQSAVSHALGRLRAVFGDPLFLRRPHGMEPTAVALSLEPQVRLAVDALREALGGPRPFDPESATGEVRIAAWDSLQSLLAPGLIARISTAAPGLRLSFRMLERAAVPEALADGRVDLALGHFPRLPGDTLAELLYEDGYAVAGRPEVIGRGLTLAAYLALPHVLVSPGGDFTGIVDTTLAGQGLARRVVAVLPQFFPALATLVRTGAVATLPARLASAFAPALGLAVCAPPLDLRPVTVSALRHARNARDPRALWLLDELRAVAGQAAPPG
ncbi:MAG: LysR substrate-binding domain-containing protein [Rhodobacteraceae bacterium]|nr:LysR substrate-binding domain-containing protein [Paracoccaceae bacterium]